MNRSEFFNPLEVTELVTPIFICFFPTFLQILCPPFFILAQILPTPASHVPYPVANLSPLPLLHFHPTLDFSLSRLLVHAIQMSFLPLPHPTPITNEAHIS